MPHNFVQSPTYYSSETTRTILYGAYFIKSDGVMWLYPRNLKTFLNLGQVYSIVEDSL